MTFLQIQEFRTGATRHNMESVHVKEENKRLKLQLTELRDKFNDVDGRVSSQDFQYMHAKNDYSISFILQHSITWEDIMQKIIYHIRITGMV